MGSRDGTHPAGIGCATGAQNYPLRGGKGAYYQGGVRGEPHRLLATPRCVRLRRSHRRRRGAAGTSFVHGAMLDPALRGTTSMGLMHVTDCKSQTSAVCG